MDLTIDVGALHEALDAKRGAEEMSWREVARELELSPSVFTRLAQGRRPDLESFLAMVGWLEVPSDKFLTGAESDKPAETLAVISTYLRADRSLKPKSAEAIEKLVRAAYEQLAQS